MIPWYWRGWGDGFSYVDPQMYGGSRRRIRSTSINVNEVFSITKYPVLCASMYFVCYRSLSTMVQYLLDQFAHKINNSLKLIIAQRTVISWNGPQCSYTVGHTENVYTIFRSRINPKQFCTNILEGLMNEKTFGIWYTCGVCHDQSI